MAASLEYGEPGLPAGEVEDAIKLLQRAGYTVFQGKAKRAIHMQQTVDAYVMKQHGSSGLLDHLLKKNAHEAGRMILEAGYFDVRRIPDIGDDPPNYYSHYRELVRSTFEFFPVANAEYRR